MALFRCGGLIGQVTFGHWFDARPGLVQGLLQGLTRGVSVYSGPSLTGLVRRGEVLRHGNILLMCGAAY